MNPTHDLFWQQRCDEYKREVERVTRELVELRRRVDKLVAAIDLAVPVYAAFERGRTHVSYHDCCTLWHAVAMVQEPVQEPVEDKGDA